MELSTEPTIKCFLVITITVVKHPFINGFKSSDVSDPKVGSGSDRISI